MENNQFYKRKTIEFDDNYQNKIEILTWEFVKLNLNFISEIIPFNLKGKKEIIIETSLVDEFLFFKNGKKAILIEKKYKSDSFFSKFKVKDFTIETIIMNNGNRYHALL